MIQKSLKDLKGLISVCNGEVPPDILVEGAEVLDVHSGCLYPANIWVYRSWIAYAGPKKPSVNEETLIIDGCGKVAVPGYIDAHGHADLFYNPSTFADFAVTRGATTVFSDAHDMVAAIGVGGFAEVLKVNDKFALKYLWGVPVTYPPYPEVEGGDLLSLDDIRQLFSTYRECSAVSEISPYVRILRNEDAILERLLMAKSFGRNIEGHILGASYDKLNTLAAAGITSCHESTKEDDVRNRLRLGLYVMIRHSSIRSDLAALCPVVKELPKDSMMLVSDGVFAHDLINKGYMDFIIKEAIRFGLAPIDAIKMCTLNPARYFKADGEIGSVTPGRIADILLLEHLENPTPIMVIEGGRVAAEDGHLIVGSAPFPDIDNIHNPYVFNSIEKDELAVERKGRDFIPVISIVDRTVTGRIDVPAGTNGERVLPLRDLDVRKVLYTRRDRKQWGKGFVYGIGADIGGIALTIGHETHGLLVLGFDDDDMVLAANSVLRMGGGVALVEKGEILHTLHLPYGAVMSDLGVNALAMELEKTNAVMRERGSTLDDPLWTMGFLTFTSIVELRLTVSGVYDVKKGEIVF
jgi:adenine deaminase